MTAAQWLGVAVTLLLIVWMHRRPSADLLTYARELGLNPRLLESKRALRRRVDLAVIAAERTRERESVTLDRYLAIPGVTGAREVRGVVHIDVAPSADIERVAVMACYLGRAVIAERGAER